MTCTKVLLLLNEHGHGMGNPPFYLNIFYNITINRQSLAKISVQVLFQWNDLNHDVDLFLHCRHVDFLTSSCQFQTLQILCRSTGSPSSRLLLLFLAFFSFSDRPTQNRKTYSTRNENKGDGLEILVKRNKKLALAKNINWTFRLLLLPSSAKIKMQMYHGILLSICIQCMIKVISRLEGV